MAKRTTRARWAEHIAAWTASGLSCGDYARKADVKPTTLGWWKWKLGSEAGSLGRPERRLEPVPFIEVTGLVAEPNRVPSLWVELADCRVEVPVGFDAETLDTTLAVIGGRA